MTLLGIDIGGTGIKGALVDVSKGELLTDRLRIPTPKKATPKHVADIVKQIVEHHNYKGPIGCGFPAVIRNGKAMSAANIEKIWIGTDVTGLLSKATQCPVLTLNDADAAGIAEMKFGAGKNMKGVIFVITVGTGLGSAIFLDGKLVPNTELGHLLIENQIAEQFVSESVRIKKELSWKKWAKRFDKYLNHLEKLFSPDLIIIGGGGSKHHDKYFKHLAVKTKIVPAQLLNEAGIIGAALAARSLQTIKLKKTKPDEKPES
jgi:polyphosphate glucokinase